ncbi:tRNA (5-methylaminomethyl-2-thiouridylate)-methyltransferase [Pontibacter sp. HJ8]
MNTSAISAAEARTAPDRVGQATMLLKYTFALVPIVAGLDKFLNLLTDWSKYLAPVVVDSIPLSPATFMYIVGAIEIVAGILVFVKPRIGALVVALWLVGIAINLLLSGQYYDVAVRDLVMAIAAFSLYLLLGDRERFA